MDVPRAGEQVYYFPGVHIKQLEQSSSGELNGRTPVSNLFPKILCHVVRVRFLVENNTEEVYAEISLLPKHDQTEPTTPEFCHLERSMPQMHSFGKVLTASDTKSNWGLSIPQKDAVKCFPLLDMTQEKPIQELIVKDLSGIEWRFKHVFGGHPRRHLLTNGWSTFVNSKKLVAGDLVVFLRGENGDVHVGFRHLPCQKGSIDVPIASSLNIKGMLAVASDAHASQKPFSVYCKPQTSQFIISLNKYLESINRGLGVSMTFSMSSEVADSNEKSFTCATNTKHQLPVNRFLHNTNALVKEDEEQMEDVEAIVYSPPQHSMTTPSRIGEKRSSDTLYISPREGNVESTCEESARKHNEVSNPVVHATIRNMEHKDTSPTEEEELIKDIFSEPSQNLPSDYTISSNMDEENFLPIIPDSEAWQKPEGVDFPMNVHSSCGDHNMQISSFEDHQSSSKVMYPITISSQTPYEGPSHADEKVHWEGYHVARGCIPILNKVISRHPNTLSSFKATSSIFQSMCLEILAELVHLLGQFTMASMDTKCLNEAKRYLRDLKLSGIEVGWLERRLAHIDEVFTMKRLSTRRQELVLGIEDTMATLRLMNEELGSLDKELQDMSYKIDLKTPAQDHPILEGLL